MRNERRLDGQGLHRLDAADRFHEEGLIVCTTVEFLMQPGSDRRRNNNRQQGIERQRRHDDQRKDRAVEPHDGEKYDGKYDVEDDRHRMTRQELPNMLQFTNPGHRVPHPTRLEIRQRERQDMAEQLRAESDVNPVRRMRKEIGPQPTQDRIEQRQGNHADRQHMERREALVDEHLVDDDLGEQRRQQGKELQEERRDQHLTEKLSVLDDRGDEPGEIELQILQTQIGSLGEEQ